METVECGLICLGSGSLRALLFQRVPVADELVGRYFVRSAAFLGAATAAATAAAVAPTAQLRTQVARRWRGGRTRRCQSVGFHLRLPGRGRYGNTFGEDCVLADESDQLLVCAGGRRVF